MHNKTAFFFLITQRFLLGFGTALLLYILAPYFQEASSQENVGIFFLITAVAILLFLLLLHRIVAIIGRARLLLFLLGITILLSTILTYIAFTSLGIFLVLIYMIVTAVIVVVMDMIIESFSTDASDGRMHGAMLSVWSAGFLIAPFVAGVIINKYTIASIFFVLLIVYGAVFIIALISEAHLSRLNHITHDGVLRLIKRAWRQPWFRRSYVLAVTLHFFYAVMVVYMPLHLVEQGFDLVQIGGIFTIMLIPFVIIEYPAGILADTILGEREMTILGLIIMAISTALVLWAPIVGVSMWAGILFFGRVGAALLESMSDIFFYKHVEGDDVGLIDLYRTASSTGYIIAMLVAVIALSLSGHNLKSTFMSIFLVVCFGLCTAVRMHDTDAIHKIS